MLKTLAAVCAAAVLPLALAPAANADEVPMSVELSPGNGFTVVRDGGEVWYTRTGPHHEFTVTITDTGGEDLDEVTAFISVPDELEVTGFEGDGWDCWDVDGGVDCLNKHYVVPGEAWPELTITSWAHDYVRDSIDVYANSSGYGPAHAGAELFVDTST